MCPKITHHTHRCNEPNRASVVHYFQILLLIKQVEPLLMTLCPEFHRVVYNKTSDIRNWDNTREWHQNGFHNRCTYNLA